MFNTKYEKMAAINAVSDLAIKLDIKYRSSPNGISILSGEPKFFPPHKLDEAISLIKERANQELQTKLM